MDIIGYKRFTEIIDNLSPVLCQIVSYQVLVTKNCNDFILKHCHSNRRNPTCSVSVVQWCGEDLYPCWDRLNKANQCVMKADWLWSSLAAAGMGW